MVTKLRRWILLDLWVMSLATISCYGGAVSYGIFWGVTFVPVISLFYLAVVYLRLRIFQQIENNHMVCGQAVPYLFVIKNESRCLFAGISVSMFSAFSTVEELPGDVEYELLPGEKWTFETRLTCRYRGEYEVGVREIVMTDFLRLFRIRYQIPNAVKVQVLPRVTRVTELKSVDSLNESARRESLRDHTEPDIVVRDYIIGDAVKQIHWKVTAREQKLKVRNRIGEEKQGISLLWDAKRCSTDPQIYLPVEDKILEIVLALGIHFAEKKIPFSDHCGQNGVTGGRVMGIGDFDGFYKRVSEVVFDEREDFHVLLTGLAERGMFAACRIVFCVVHAMDDEILKIVEKLDRAGTLSVFYVVTDADMERYVRQSSERHRIIPIPVAAELEGML